MKLSKRLQGFGIILVSYLIYIFTIYSPTKAHSLDLSFFVLIFILGSLLFKRKNTILMTYLVISFVMILVGATGWYFSPFFSWVYIVAIALGFLFDPIISTFFVGGFALILSPNIGSIDFTLDILTLISLLSIIPLTSILRHEYLKLKENEKKILIMENEHERYKSALEQVLANKVSKIAVDVREPINDIRQLAYIAKGDPKKRQVKDDEKIIELTDRTINLLKKFEEEATGKRLKKTPK